jgi:hypothetical protein
VTNRNAIDISELYEQIRVGFSQIPRKSLPIGGAR